MRAVLERDYLAEARRPRAFLARTVIGGIAAGALLLASISGWEVLLHSPDRIGSRVFVLLGRAAFAFVAVLTPTLLVGTILAERRRNTLPLVLASPVTGTGLALGKFLSRTGTVLGWTAAALPPLVITLLFGGVSGREVLNLGFALLGSVLELGAWGLLVSCLVRRMATAVVFVYLLPLLHWGPFLGGALGTSPAALALAATTPLPAVLGLASWPGFPAPAGIPGALRPLLEHPGLGHFLFSLLLAGGSVLLAGRLLGREEERRGRIRRRRPRSSADGRFRRALTGGNPVAWKESLLLNAAGSRSLYYAFGAALVGGEIVFLSLHRIGQWTPEWNFHFVWIAAAALATLASITGAASMAQEKGQGSLDLLRISLLTPGEIARGKVAGVAVGLGWLLLLPLGHLAVTAAVGLAHPAAALAAAAAAAVLVACYLVLGVHWGAISGAAWGALAGAVALPVFGLLGCTLCCVLPLLVVVINMARAGTRSFLEAVALPGIVCGPAWLSVGALGAMVHGLLSEDPFPRDANLGVFGALFLVVQGIYAYRTWRNLPAVVRREMARASEGEDAITGLAPYRIPARARLTIGPDGREGAP